MTTIKALLFISVFCASHSFAQTDEINGKIDSLKYLDKDAYKCNSVYWRIVAIGKDAIPLLISRMDDTTLTEAAYVCKKGKLKLGDLCYKVLEEIMEIPTFYVTHVQFDLFEGECQVGVYGYLERERKKFKQQVSSYYETYKNDLKFVKFSYPAGEHPNACKIKYKIYGYFDVDPKLLKDANN